MPLLFKEMRHDMHVCPKYTAFELIAAVISGLNDIAQ